MSTSSSSSGDCILSNVGGTGLDGGASVTSICGKSDSLITDVWSTVTSYLSVPIPSCAGSDWPLELCDVRVRWSLEDRTDGTDLRGEAKDTAEAQESTEEEREEREEEGERTRLSWNQRLHTHT